jgi:hypothetical protein
MQKGGCTMKKLPMESRWIWPALILLALFTGCSTLGGDKKDSEPAAAVTPDKNAPLYRDFADILIPGELNVDRNETNIIKGSGFAAGVLALQGRVEINSLVAFFENNMRKDNWQMISEFKSERTMMLYQKDSRWCVIEVAEGTYYTLVKIWVAPSRGDAVGSLLK